jgi:hypothetical protein
MHERAGSCGVVEHSEQRATVGNLVRAPPVADPRFGCDERSRDDSCSGSNHDRLPGQCAA